MSLLLAGPLVSCSGSTSSGSGTSSTDDTDEESSGGGSSGFEVSGTLSSLSVSALSLKDAAISGTVTDVIAVSPGTTSVSCKTASVDTTTNTFEIPLTGKKPWFFYFFNRNRTGSQMFMGRFRSSLLDTLLPNKTTGSLSLGTVSIDGSTGVATSSRDHSDIVSDLGLESETADTIGDHDDVSRRYSNPDVDGDGSVDCDGSSSSYTLDFHIRFNMLINGTQAEVDDLVDSFYNESTTTVAYTDTGAYVSYPTTFSSLDTGTVTLTDTAVTTQEGGALAAGTATSKVTSNNFSSHKGFGINTTSTSELPSGEMIYAFGDKTLTFSDVETPSLASLTSPSGRLFPFIKFNKSSSTCTSSCTLSGISYKWMKKTASGWTSATLEEVDLLVSDANSNLGFRVDGNESRQVSFTIPKTSLTGTIDWDSSSASLTGITSSQFESLTTSQICHVGLSFDDQLGMRYFQNISNSSDSCTS